MTMQLNLSGHTALVTGAGRGLGRDFSLMLAQAGARVVLAARSLDKLAPLQAEIAQAGGVCAAVQMEVTDASSVAQGFDAAERALGLVDIVVNNAGVGGGHRVLEAPDSEWDEVIDTNLSGAYHVAREGARRLVAAKRGGSIVNIASILGERVGMGVVPYAASKAGLIQLTKGLALEWARYGIRVNALAPGYIVTDLNRAYLLSEAGEKMRARIPSRQFGSPKDLEAPLLLLCSDASAYMTGSVLTIDGGHLCSAL